MLVSRPHHGAVFICELRRSALSTDTNLNDGYVLNITDELDHCDTFSKTLSISEVKVCVTEELFSDLHLSCNSFLLV